MEEVIMLPATNENRPAKKRIRTPKFDPQQEETKRQRNVKTLSVLRENDSSVKLLEDLVFGAEDELLERLVEDERSGTHLDDDTNQHDSGESEEESEAHLQIPSASKAAWVDEDDEIVEEVDLTHRFRNHLMKSDTERTMTKQKLQQRMKEQFQKSMGGTPSWAENRVKKKKKRKVEKDDEDDEDEDDDKDDNLMMKAGNFVSSSTSLPAGILEMKKCCHANHDRPSTKRLTTVQFHPSAQVIMTAGLDRSISLFQVDGKTNPKIQSLNLERFPIYKAQFTPDGEKVVATSQMNKMFYLYDMMEGRVVPVHSIRGLNEPLVKDFYVYPEGETLLLTGSNGYLHVLKLKSSEVVHSMKLNHKVAGVAFSPDGSKVFTSSEEGEVYVWDMRSSRCMNRFTDDGCVRATSLAASRNGQYLACGSQSGVVNVYSQEACLNSANPTPLKAVLNLLTSATSLSFNPSSEILAIASRVTDEAVRLVHLPSLTVFSNFPIFKRKLLFQTNCLDFSPNSGFFSLANNNGTAHLFRLLHYRDF